MADEETIFHTTGRNNCGGRCVLHVHTQAGEVTRITGDRAPDGTPEACARGLLCAQTFLRRDRLRWPMRRVGERGEGKFERISWDEAVDVIARETARIRDAYGPGARYVNYATGISAALHSSRFAKRLLCLDGGFLDYYNSYSTAAIAKATELMYGTTQTGSELESWLDSRLILLWGHNPAETVFDGTMRVLRAVKARGIPIVVIDPRESDTVRALGARWIPIRPATDSAMTDAMAYVLYTEHLHDQAFLDRCCLGFDEAHLPDGAPAGSSYVSYLLGGPDSVPKTPAWAEAITGVPAETIRSLAIQLAQAKPATLISGYGAQRHAYGEQSTRGVIALACMTGNVGVRGGWAGGVAYFSRHAKPQVPVPENPYPMQIPSFRWTDALERRLTSRDGVTGGTQLETPIKQIFNLAGNCLINQHGDINRTAQLLRDERKCEFIVCSDLFLTPSARFADILLPGQSMLECENLTSPWCYGDFLGYGAACVEPVGESRFEYDWLAEVAAKLGVGEAFTEGLTSAGWLRRCYDTLRAREPELPELETFRAAGIWRYRDNPPHVAFERECRDPERFPFPTASGKIELYSPQVASLPLSDFFPAIPRYVAPPEGPDDALAERYPLQLVGYHTKRRCHSIHDNNDPLRSLDPQALWMHPTDAAARAISDGDEVYCWNDRGTVRVRVRISERVMPGVTALAQGAWYDPDERGIDRGGSINVLTSLRPTPYARGNTQHTILIEVRRCAPEEEPPCNWKQSV